MKKHDSGSMTTIEALIKICRSKNWRIGFANGCFDNLHAGHTHLLTEARKHCDILFVGINDDKSVKLLKGKKRPFRPLDVRIKSLMGTELVGGVFTFHSEDDLLNLIKEIKPDVLVKGGDYVGLGLTGDEFVRQSGGRVILIPLKQGYSTSRLN